MEEGTSKICASRLQNPYRDYCERLTTLTFVTALGSIFLRSDA